MEALFSNSIDAMGGHHIHAWICHVVVLLYAARALWVFRGPHGVAACDEICKHVMARMREVEDWISNFHVRIIKFDTSVEVTSSANVLQH